MTDIRDIGRYVARIIDDERTLNQYIFAYSELWTQTAIAEKLEAMSGDRVHKQPISREDLLQRNAEATEALKQEPDDRNNLQGKWMTDYAVSMFLRGDNQPGYAKYLGYLTSKELYPDMEFRSLESYIEEVLAGTARVVYMTNEAIQNWASTK
ncbi:hypothetical protein KEM55_001375 [Ascosphaera atra]|nr:hypothetical protein KEM55_007479 [Ascosphaera atra]KAI5301981.1 hypothetical protein KEM55_001375 [Ascosphaera atra]